MMESRSSGIGTKLPLSLDWKEKFLLSSGKKWGTCGLLHAGVQECWLLGCAWKLKWKATSPGVAEFVSEI